MFRVTFSSIILHSPHPRVTLLHLGLVSSNGVARNASRDCPLSEHSIPPETLRGQWPPLQEHNNKTVALNTPFRLLLSFFFFTKNENKPNNLSTDYRHPFVHNIHCIATHTIIGIPLTFLLTNVLVQWSWRSDCVQATIFSSLQFLLR